MAVIIYAVQEHVGDGGAWWVATIATPVTRRDRWVSDDNHLLALYDFTYPIENDIALHARWMPGDCTVSFDADGGAPQPDNQVVAYGKTASKPSADPSKSGFEFKGWWVLAEKLVDAGVADDIRSNTAFDDIFWVTDDNSLRMPFDFGSDIVYEDTTLYARWQPNVNTVLFVDEAGNVVHEQKAQSGNAPIEIEGGSDGGYHFDGWFADAARSVKYDFSQPIHSDTTIYGTWTQQLLTVTFDSNGGSAVSPAVQQVAYESLATDPGNPVWDGHGFLGWYEDASDELTPDDLAKLKAELNEAIATEGIDSEIKAELEQYRQEIEKRVAVIDGKVKVAYNPSSDHVYSDMTVQAQWTEEGSLATEIVRGDGVPQIVAPNLNEVARALVTPEEIKQGAVVRLKITLIDPSAALPRRAAGLQRRAMRSSRGSCRRSAC